MDWVSLIDVSSFFLFEASGDSEADFDPIVAALGCKIDLADDDAESCSWDRVEDDINVDDQDYNDNYNGNCDGGDQDLTCQKMGLSDMTLGSVCSKRDQDPRVGVDAIKKINEMEENKVFWETCLALGYP